MLNASRCSGRDEPIAPTHWSFGQICSLVGAPSGYLRELPAPRAGINLQHRLLNHRAELMKTLETEVGRTELLPNPQTTSDTQAMCKHERGRL